jgi:hypothetical protein
MDTFDTASGSATTFLAFRLAIAGASSNFTILDTFSNATSASTSSLAGRVVTYVNASQISANYYESAVANITSYVTNSIINLKTNVSNTGAVTLKINSLAVVGLKKVDSTGTIVDLVSGDLVANQYYLSSYNGTYYVIMGSISSGSALSISGSSVMSTTTGSVVKHNVSGITTGSYNQVFVDSYGHITAGSVVSSGITYSGSAPINISGSTISHNTTSVVPGNYLSANITVDDKGHITSASSGASASSVGAPSDSPFITSSSNVNLTNYKILTAGNNITITSASPNGGAITVSAGSYVNNLGTSTSNAIARFAGTGGSIIQNSVPTIDDTGNVSLSGKQIQNYAEKLVSTSASATYAIDWSSGNIFEVTLTGNATLTFSNLLAGRSITTVFIQDGTGSRVPSLPSVKWSSGSSPLLSTAGSAIDIITFFVGSNGSTVYGFPAGLDMK